MRTYLGRRLKSSRLWHAVTIPLLQREASATGNAHVNDQNGVETRVDARCWTVNCVTSAHGFPVHLSYYKEI